MEKLKEFIEKKKEKSASRKPRYGTRKLSVGLVSCVLGYCIFLSPSVVNAQVAEGASEESGPAAIERSVDSTEAVEKDNSDKKETEAVFETPVAEKTETPVAEVEEKEVAEVSEEVEIPAEEAETKEEAPVLEAEGEKEEEEEKISLEEEVAPEEELSEEEIPAGEENLTEEAALVEEEKLELGEEADPEALAAGEETEAGRDISNEVQSKYVALTEEGHETKGTVKPDAGEAIGWEVSFTSPKGTKAGDYFTIDLSDNLSLKGIEPDHENEYPIDIDGKVVADGVRVDRSTIKYTFNENINDERNVVVSVKGFAYIDKTKVPNNTTDEKISIKLGETVDEHNINVQYGKPFYTGDKLNGMSQFTEFDPKTGEYTQVFYINPDSKTITTSTRNWATGKVVAFIDGITPDGSHSDVNYTEENTTVTVQKLPAGTKVPDAIIENPVKTDEPTTVKTTFRDGGIEIVFADNSDDKLRKNNIDSPYIITVKSKAAPSQTGNNVYSRATFYGDGSKFHIMDNNIVTTVGDTEAQGEKIGYFKEHHVYYTKVDGVLQEDKTFTLHSNKTEGHDYDKYFTSKNVIDDFKFIKVDTGKLVENPVYNEDGTIARGNYEPGKTKEVTYIYERDVKHGSFQEHHIYQTLDENGEVIAKETVTKDGTETTGIDENEYSTSKKDQEGNVVTEEKDKDGYKLVEVKATNDKSKELGVQFDGQGAATSGNYVNGEKLEVTYIYQKTEVKQTPIEETGKFQEHHIYRTIDKNGEVTEEKVDGKVTGGTKDMTYTTGKVDKEGFTFVGTENPVENPTFSTEGESTTGKFKPGVKQEITYVYEKKEKAWTPIEETGKFQEHHIYRTIDKNGEVTEEKVDGKVTGGTKDMTYTTGKVDKEGFTFVGTENPVENPTFSTEGESTTGKFKPGVKQEITYVYEKTETPWTPLEPSTPVDPSEPTKPEEPKDTTPLVPLTPAEEVEVERITHHDHKTPGTPVVTELPSTPVVETEKPVEEKTEETKEVENKEENVEEVKEVEEVKPVEGEDEVVEKVETNEVDKNLAPVSTNDDTKAPKTGDAGILSSAGLASLAASGLAYLELKKRNKKNK